MKKSGLAIITLIASLLASCSGPVKHQMNEYFTDVEWKNDDFKILQLSDIHLSNSDILEYHYKFMDLTISEANADFIILNGDSFTFADKRVVKSLFNYINSKGILWTFTYGNHDDQGYYNDQYLCEVSKEFSNCRFINFMNDGIDGRGNFVVNLKKGENVAYQLYLMDSHSYRYEDFGYDNVKESQINWYKDAVKYTAETYGEDILSSLFMHIPVYEFREAMKDTYPDIADGKGDQEGTSGAPETNNGFFQVIKDCGSTQSIICAHDHKNNKISLYDGIYCGYGVHATDRIYYANDMLGGLLMTIKSDCSLQFHDIYHTYEEVK